MSKRTYFIAGNWKMNCTTDEARSLVRGILPGLGEAAGVRAAVCPPFTALGAVANLIGDSALALGGQNCHEKESGAYTGEVAPSMLKDVGCQHVILGHSERRQYFGETDDLIRTKTNAALAAGLDPIVCVGESEAERDAGDTAKVIETQVRGCLTGLDTDKLAERVTIAYEPVWAIGTGKTATPEMAQEVHAQIRGLVKELYDQATADGIVIQYGGSMKPANAAELLAQPDIDGGLIGGAALKADSFLELLKIAAKS